MRVRLKFDGTWHIEERWKIRFAEAKQVLIAWLKDHPRIIERVQEEYRAIKQIGVRSLEAARKPPFAQHEPTVREKKIGRNAPCICGSGKKYKKCCGK
jgi:preprotein translocase subunit SecA